MCIRDSDLTFSQRDIFFSKFLKINTSQKAISLGKSVLTGKAQGFVYPIEEEEEE